MAKNEENEAKRYYVYRVPFVLGGRRAFFVPQLLDSSFDGIFSKHGTVELDRRKVQMLSDLTVLYRDGLVNMLTFDPLSDNTAACDGRPATKRLEARIYDVAVVIDPDLKLHDVTACGSADKPSPDVRVALVCGEKRDSTERCQSKRDKFASRQLEVADVPNEPTFRGFSK